MTDRPRPNPHSPTNMPGGALSGSLDEWNERMIRDAHKVAHPDGWSCPHCGRVYETKLDDCSSDDCPSHDATPEPAPSLAEAARDAARWLLIASQNATGHTAERHQQHGQALDAALAAHEREQAERREALKQAEEAIGRAKLSRNDPAAVVMFATDAFAALARCREVGS